MDSDDNTSASAPGPVRRRGRLWLWFAAGFLLAFSAMLLLVHMTAMHPSGQFAVRYPLWQYYVVVFPRAFGTTTLGPAGDESSAVIEVLGVHVLLAAGAGCVAAGVGWCLRRRG
jgi:hypothetical protein